MGPIQLSLGYVDFQDTDMADHTFSLLVEHESSTWTLSTLGGQITSLASSSFSPAGRWSSPWLYFRWENIL